VTKLWDACSDLVNALAKAEGRRLSESRLSSTTRAVNSASSNLLLAMSTAKSGPSMDVSRSMAMMAVTDEAGRLVIRAESLSTRRGEDASVPEDDDIVIDCDEWLSPLSTAIQDLQTYL